jgi:hypothetical protein
MYFGENEILNFVSGILDCGQRESGIESSNRVLNPEYDCGNALHRFSTSRGLPPGYKYRYISSHSLPPPLEISTSLNEV